MEIAEPHLLADVLIIDVMGKDATPHGNWVSWIPNHERYNRDRIVMVTTNYTEAEENTLREGFEQGPKRKNGFSVILSASESEKNLLTFA